MVASLATSLLVPTASFANEAANKQQTAPVSQSSTSASKAEPAKSEPAKSEPTKAEVAKSEPAKSEPAKSEPAKQQSSAPAPSKAEEPKPAPKEEPKSASSSSSTNKSTGPAETKVTSAPTEPYVNGAPDKGDNRHPSGNDRSTENGKSGTQGTTGTGSPAVQGKSMSDPDQNGKGPERNAVDNKTPDKPGYQGGIDRKDQDTNNGCGNDDDFEDDNEGWCGKAKKTSTTPPSGSKPDNGKPQNPGGGNSGQHNNGKYECPDGSWNSDTDHGANQGSNYDSTCDGRMPGNGKGDGNKTGQPCAGCVGNADYKNPKGQLPNGNDHNAGYECDRNQGVGKENPAHTGCQDSTTPPPAPTPCPDGSMPDTSKPGNPCKGNNGNNDKKDFVEGCFINKASGQYFWQEKTEMTAAEKADFYSKNTETDMNRGQCKKEDVKGTTKIDGCFTEIATGETKWYRDIDEKDLPEFLKTHTLNPDMKNPAECRKGDNNPGNGNGQKWIWICHFPDEHARREYILKRIPDNAVDGHRNHGDVIFGETEPTAEQLKQCGAANTPPGGNNPVEQTFQACFYNTVTKSYEVVTIKYYSQAELNEKLQVILRDRVATDMSPANCVNPGGGNPGGGNPSNGNPGGTSNNEERRDDRRDDRRDERREERRDETVTTRISVSSEAQQPAPVPAAVASVIDETPSVPAPAMVEAPAAPEAPALVNPVAPAAPAPVGSIEIVAAPEGVRGVQDLASPFASLIPSTGQQLIDLGIIAAGLTVLGLGGLGAVRYGLKRR